MAEQKQKQLIAALSSDNKDKVLKALQEVRTHGGKEVFPQLFDLLRNNKDTEIRKVLTSLLNDSKQEDTQPYFIDAICDPRNKEHLAIIVSACWQSGLDYSKYIELFVPLMATDDAKVTIEAYSVFESQIDELSSEQRTVLVAALKKPISQASELQKELIVELIHLLA